MSKQKDAAATDAIFEYLMNQNRPYSVNDIVQNLHKEHGKTAVQKALDQLVADGKIREKTYGKQKVYAVEQSLLPAADEKELAAMDARISQLTDEIKSEEEALKKLETELKGTNSSLTTAEAKEQLAKVLEENARLEKKLEDFTHNNVKVSATDFKQVKQEKEKNVNEWRKRKRMCNEVLDAILEGYPKNKKSLFEDIGIETDEDVGVKMVT